MKLNYFQKGREVLEKISPVGGGGGGTVWILFLKLHNVECLGQIKKQQQHPYITHLTCQHRGCSACTKLHDTLFLNALYLGWERGGYCLQSNLTQSIEK